MNGEAEHLFSDWCETLFSDGSQGGKELRSGSQRGCGGLGGKAKSRGVSSPFRKFECESTELDRIDLGFRKREPARVFNFAPQAVAHSGAGSTGTSRTLLC